MELYVRLGNFVEKSGGAARWARIALSMEKIFGGVFLLPPLEGVVLGIFKGTFGVPFPWFCPRVL